MPRHIDMPRLITEHHDGHGLNDLITIKADAKDEVNGHASHVYQAEMDVHRNGYLRPVAHIQFQHGPRGVEGSTPGITDQALLEVLIDRYEGFQSGKYECAENEVVLMGLYQARDAMRDRIRDRAARGVLGKLEE